MLFARKLDRFILTTRAAKSYRKISMDDAEIASKVGDNLQSVLSRIEHAVKANNIKQNVHLVAVSKTKPVQLIEDCYAAGQRHFGENYVQELCEKAAELHAFERCVDIQWHFIGTLQTNKANNIAKCPNLTVVETVNTFKLADALNIACVKHRPEKERLKVFVQVNTSGEENKSGATVDEAHQIARHINDKCPYLQFVGFMTIGSFAHSKDEAAALNPDFAALSKCAHDYCDKYGITLGDLQLSMGMSHDFEKAIAQGSTNVRIGSTIFGERAPKV